MSLRFVHVALIGVALSCAAGPFAAPPADPPQILLSRQLVEARGIDVGQIVQLSVDPEGAAPRPFRVVGIYEPVADPFRLTSLRLESRFHLADLNDLIGDPEDPLAPESVSRINVALRDAADTELFDRDLTARMPGIYARSTERTVDGSDPFVVLERFHMAIASVTVVGSAAFLLALMVIRSEERRESAGILRLIGFSRPRILLGVFVEGLWVALAGALFGLLLALVVQGLFNRFFQWHYDTPLVFVRVTPAIAAKCVAISVPLGIAAGVVASWTLLRRNIMALLRR